MAEAMTPPPLRLETLSGDALPPVLPALAGLRCTVFAEYPYLYAGDPASEAEYLATYAASPGAAAVVAFDGETPVGMATCQPMAEAHAPVRDAFARRGMATEGLCYFGESVLLPAYRGRGAGVGFFAAREAHARSLGLTAAAFCAVVRNANDPRKPPGYRPLDQFWRNRGYVPRPDLSCIFHWQEVGDDRETPHSLGFWLKERI
ncbi:N-acetyltransferase [Siccirubricoccus deserti]|nr:N-acetyltransferase [Siccirubricoccus deserti]